MTMTLTRLILVSVFLLASGTGKTVACDGFTAVGTKGRKIIEAVRHANQKSKFIGAVLAAEQGQVIAAVGVGTTGEKRGKSTEVDTLFEIASCSKIFTAQTVMLLVQSDKLSLEDPIEQYMTRVPNICSAITIRHLLRHTSGIPGNNSLGRRKLAKVLPLFLKGGPQHEPGTRHEYWNQSYALSAR